MAGYIHSFPGEAGKVFDLVRPRLAVGYHFYNDFDTAPETEAEIRKNDEGPLALAKDLMVFNVTREQEAARKPKPVMSPWLSERQIFPK
ncbi:MAG: hypothetical protein ACT4P4_19920 [Betaproteobacteria bacterium]